MVWILSHAGFLGSPKWLCNIITFTERVIPEGKVFIHQLCPQGRIWIIFRATKVDELALALRKQSEIFMPMHEKVREIAIQNYIYVFNAERTLAISSGKVISYPEMTRSQIDLSKFCMNKNMDGCGSELNAIIALINAYNNENDVALGSVGVANEEGEETDDNETDDAFNMSEFDAELSSILPNELTVTKCLSQGTMLKQTHDVGTSKNYIYILNWLIYLALYDIY